MNFSEALEGIKRGESWARSGWNGKYMFVFLVKGSGPPGAWTYTDGKQDNYATADFIAMKTADDKVVPWLASQTDLLAGDWETTG